MAMTMVMVPHADIAHALMAVVLAKAVMATTTTLQYTST
jgi:hypothetical protein